MPHTVTLAAHGRRGLLTAVIHRETSDLSKEIYCGGRSVNSPGLWCVSCCFTMVLVCAVHDYYSSACWVSGTTSHHYSFTVVASVVKKLHPGQCESLILASVVQSLILACVVKSILASVVKSFFLASVVKSLIVASVVYLDCIGLDRLDWIGLDWIGLESWFILLRLFLRFLKKLVLSVAMLVKAESGMQQYICLLVYLG